MFVYVPVPVLRSEDTSKVTFSFKVRIGSRLRLGSAFSCNVKDQGLSNAFCQ